MMPPSMELSFSASTAYDAAVVVFDVEKEERFKGDYGCQNAHHHCYAWSLNSGEELLLFLEIIFSYLITNEDKLEIPLKRPIICKHVTFNIVN